MGGDPWLGAKDAKDLNLKKLQHSQNQDNKKVSTAQALRWWAAVGGVALVVSLSLFALVQHAASGGERPDDIIVEDEKLFLYASELYRPIVALKILRKIQLPMEASTNSMENNRIGIDALTIFRDFRYHAWITRTNCERNHHDLSSTSTTFNGWFIEATSHFAQMVERWRTNHENCRGTDTSTFEYSMG